MRNKRLLISILCLLLMGGCAKIRDWWQTTKGSLVGLSFEIAFYDDYGNKTLGINGKNVDVGVFEENSSWFQDEEENSAFPSEVIEITIDKDQVLQVGNTVIFAEKGIDMIEDFEMSENISTNNNGLNWIPFDRYVNDLKNQIGKNKTIIVMSQMGIPIGVYQGNSVYVSVPEELPKMTRLNIDGKSLYIHRANYVIIDTNLID